MPMLIDIKAFLAAARSGGFSAAGRELGTTPSVVAKRVNRLEAEIGARLFHRSTRKLSLTPEGVRLRPRVQALVSELEATLIDLRVPSQGLRGSLRIRAPTTIGTMYLGPSVARFQVRNPETVIELLLIDRLLNPLEEGFDVSFGALPQSFSSVEQTPICPYPRILVAAPGYVEARGAPQTPEDIIAHDCLAFVPVGLTWTFQSERGPLSVDIRARFTVNDSRLLADAAIAGLGLTVVPEFIARAPLEDGRLVALMPAFRSSRSGSRRWSRTTGRDGPRW